MSRLPEQHPDRWPEASWMGKFARTGRRMVEELTRGGQGFAGLPLANRSLVNLPGRDTIRYRVGTYTTFLADLLYHLGIQEIPNGPNRGTAPLAKLNLEEPGNWIMALLHAWAMVGEVLTFYQERIANEGYLGTATESLSVHELLYTVGYTPHPGTAAVTHLSFRISGARGMPEQVTLPRGARIQSLPVRGRPLQIFETDEALAGRAEWNSIEARVARLHRRPPFTTAATGVKLAGLKSAVEPGTSLVVTGTLEDPLDGLTEQRWWRTVKKAEKQPATRRRTAGGSALERLLAARDQTGGSGATEPSATEVSWKEPLDPAPSESTESTGSAGSAEVAGEREIADPRVFRLRRQGSLFGHNAPAWSTLPANVRHQLRPPAGGVTILDESGESWRQINDGLPAKPVRALEVSADGLLFAATSTGLYRRLEEDPWTLLESVGHQAVTALAADDAGTVWAATSTGGVLRSGDGGDAWEPVAGHRPTGPVSRRLGRLLRQPPRQVRLPRSPIHTLLPVPSRRGRRLLAGTDKGIFSTRDRGDGWQPLNHGLPGTDAKTGLAGLAVFSLAVDGRGALWAGTAKGVFRARRPGARWHPVNGGLPGVDPKTGLAATPVVALATYDDRRTRRRRLAAATAAGVFHCSGAASASLFEHRSTWRPTGQGLPGIGPASLSPTQETTGDGGSAKSKAAVGALAVRSDPRTLTHELWAATATGLFRSSDHGETWLPSSAYATAPTGTTGVTAVTVGRSGEWKGAVLAAAPLDDPADGEWPGFHLQGRAVDLASVVPQIAAGGWIVLTESLDDGPPRVGIYQVESVSTVRRQDFRLDSLVTRIVVDRGHQPGEPGEPDELDTFDLRRTVVHYGSEELALWSEEIPLVEPLDPHEIAVEPLSNPLEVGRVVIVTGRALRLTLAPGTDPVPLHTAAGAEGTDGPTIRPGDVVTLTAPPRRREDRMTLSVHHPDAGDGWIEVAPAAVRWLSAAEDSALLAHLTRVAGFTNQAPPPEAPAEDETPAPQVSLVALDPPLVHGLDPATASLLANVARASQGETVVERLDGGQVSRAHRSLTLARPPLSWLPAATPRGIASTLDVRAGGMRWQEIPSLRKAGPQDRVFVVRRDLEGRPHLLFGDDREGARLPKGHGNVQATYRSGMWTDPLPPGHLNLLQTRPLGAQGVTNPLPVDGATPPELLDEGRTRAPRATRALERIVSVRDFEDFVASFPGVERTHLRRLPLPETAGGPVPPSSPSGPSGQSDRSGQLIQITVAGPEGRAVDGALYDRLVEAVASYRVPGPRVRIDSYRRVGVVLGARVRPAPDELPAEVVERVRAHLTEALGFRRARFCQTLTASEILAGIQEVRGVVEVELTAFHAAGAAPEVALALHAAPATWQRTGPRSASTVRPAELLILDLPDGLRLEVIRES